MPKFNHPNIGDIQKYVYRTAVISAIDGDNDTVDIVLDGNALAAVPLFYHCAMNSVQRENGALEGAAGAFAVNDSVIVRCLLIDNGALSPACIVAREDGPKPCCEWVENFGAILCENHNWRVPYILAYYQLNPAGDDDWFWPCHSLPFYRDSEFLSAFRINMDCDIVAGAFHMLNYVEVLRESNRFYENYTYGLYWKQVDNVGDLPPKDGVLKFKFSSISAEVYAGDGSVPHVDWLSARNFIYIWWESGEPLLILLPRAKNANANYPVLPPEMTGRVVDATDYVNGEEVSVDLSEYWDVSMGEIDRMLIGNESIAEQPLDPWDGIGDEITLWAKSEFTLDSIKIC